MIKEKRVIVHFKRKDGDSHSKTVDVNPDSAGVPYKPYGGDIIFQLKKEKIPESGPRPKGLWGFMDKKKQKIYYTRPWCAGVNLVDSTSLYIKPRHCEGTHHCLWCIKCNRHLWVKFCRP